MHWLKHCICWKYDKLNRELRNAFNTTIQHYVNMETLLYTLHSGPIHPGATPSHLTPLAAPIYFPNTSAIWNIMNHMTQAE